MKFIIPLLIATAALAVAAPVSRKRPTSKKISPQEDFDVSGVDVTIDLGLELEQTIEISIWSEEDDDDEDEDSTVKRLVQSPEKASAPIEKIAVVV